MNDSDVWIIELDVPPERGLMLQAWLLGEDGLGVIRCLDDDKRKQQFWTTLSQKDDAHEWLKSLPEYFLILREWRW
ncbi:MAG: DUF4911 domain-containing protein [Mariprofundaceae bacterium]|nr:DUF4911 domain-containing protein [Mariprofundaceae bacterium]